jgi:hypothetical protein
MKNDVLSGLTLEIMACCYSLLEENTKLDVLSYTVEAYRMSLLFYSGAGVDELLIKIVH